MFKTRTIVAIVLFALVAGIVLFVRSRPDPHAVTELPPGKAPAGAPAPVKAEDIDELDIQDGANPATVLKKEGGVWKLTAPIQDAADKNNVEQALKTLADVQFKEIVAESKDSYEKLQIRDEDVTRVVAKGAGKPLLSLAIGKSGHVRVGDLPSVWSVSKLSRFAFARELKMWRNREVFRFEKDQVDRVEVALGDKKLVAKREVPPTPVVPDGGPPPPPAQDKWNLVEGQALVGGALDESVAAQVATTLSRLDVVEFGDAATAEKAGLATPRALATVVLTDGSKKSLEVGNEEGVWVYARVAGESRIFMVRKATAEALTRSPLQWRDKTLVKLDGKEVNRVEIVKGGEKAYFERVDDKTWKSIEPKQLPELDSARVTGVANAFVNLRAAQIAELTAKDAKTGLAKPSGTIKLYKKGVATPALSLTIGALVEKAYYVQVAGRPEVFTLPDSQVNRWLKTADEFKSSATPSDFVPGMAPGPPPFDPHP